VLTVKLLSQKLSFELSDEGLLAELEALNREVDNLNIQKGEILKVIKILKDANNEIADFEKEIYDVKKLIR